MAGNIRLEVVTPENVIVDEEAQIVMVRETAYLRVKSQRRFHVYII